MRILFRQKELDSLEIEMRGLSTFEVSKWAIGGQKGSFKQVAAEVELERRRFWRNFFTTSIISWVALGVSIFSLILSFWKYSH